MEFPQTTIEAVAKEYQKNLEKAYGLTSSAGRSASDLEREAFSQALRVFRSESKNFFANWGDLKRACDRYLKAQDKEINKEGKQQFKKDVARAVVDRRVALEQKYSPQTVSTILHEYLHKLRQLLSIPQLREEADKQAFLFAIRGHSEVNPQDHELLRDLMFDVFVHEKYKEPHRFQMRSKEGMHHPPRTWHSIEDGIPEEEELDTDKQEALRKLAQEHRESLPNPTEMKFR